MKITVLTLFPKLFQPLISTSILDRAVDKKLVEFELVDLRQFGEGKHKSIDDRPFGGGPGMIFRADVLARAWEDITQKSASKPLTILTSASGVTYKQSTAEELSKLEHILIICGHYEGVDQRFIDKYVDAEISIGDYVLTGGEIPAMVIMDSVTRLLPGALKKEEATLEESFSSASGRLLEYPQYTRPEDFAGLKMPEVLLSGNHQEIKKWRREKSLQRTRILRPDLLGN